MGGIDYIRIKELGYNYVGRPIQVAVPSENSGGVLVLTGFMLGNFG